MRKMLKLLCVMLSVLICLTMYIPAASAEELDGIYISTSGVSTGELFMVYVRVPAQDLYAQAANIRVTFDPEVFEVVDLYTDLDISLMNWNTYYDNTRGCIVVSTVDASEDIYLGNGLDIYAKLAVRDSAPAGISPISLSTHKLYSYDVNTLASTELWEYPAVTYGLVDVTRYDQTRRDPVTGGGISLSSYSLYPGSSFDVIITVPPINTYAEDFIMNVNFDGSVFEVLRWSPDIRGAESRYGRGYFGLNATNNFASIDLTRGLTLYATLLVRQDAPAGSYKFNLDHNTLSYYDSALRTDLELWTPYTTSATASVTNFSRDNALYPYPTTWYTGMVEVPSVTTTTRRTYETIRTPDEADEIDYDEGTVYSDNIDSESKPPETTADTTRPVPVYDDDDDDLDEENGFTILDIDTDDDEDDPDENDDSNIIPIADSYEITLECSDLNGLSAGSVLISTKHSYFNSDTVIYMGCSEYADSIAHSALKQLGMYDNIYYPFDINVYSVGSNRYLSVIPNDGSIMFQMPVPATMTSAPDGIEVFHIVNGKPEVIDRKIIRENGQIKVQFDAYSFSPYVIVDTAHTRTSSVKPGTSTGVSLVDDKSQTPHNGNLNPSTGVVAAVTIPAAMTGCILLARKTVRRRKRAKSHIDADKDDNS